jgi:hypothetical protein
MNQFGITFGIFFGNFLAIFVNYKVVAVVGAIVGFALCFGSCFLPEFQNTQTSARYEMREPESLLSGRNITPFIAGCLMMAFQQLSGCNAVLSNLSYIATGSGGPAIASACQCVAVLFSVYVIKGFGRRWAWCVSLSGASLAMIILAVPWGEWIDAVLVSVTGAGLFLFCFCLGLGPIPWFLPPEWFGDQIRATATGIFSSLNWFISFCVVWFFPPAGNATPRGVYTLFASILAIGAVFGWYILGEKGIVSPVALSEKNRDALCPVLGENQ